MLPALPGAWMVSAHPPPAVLLRPRLSSLLAAGLHPHPRLPPPTTLKYGVRHPRFFTTSSLPPRPSLGPHFAFCLGFGVAGLAAAAVLTNNDTAQRLKTLSRPSAWYGVERGLVASRTQDLITRARAFIRLFDPSLFWPTILAENYVSLTEAQRTCLGIVVFQGGVWVLWKIPALRRFCTRYLWHDPKIKGRTITHLTSIFSHRVSPFGTLVVLLSLTHLFHVLGLITSCVVPSSSPHVPSTRLTSVQTSNFSRCELPGNIHSGTTSYGVVSKGQRPSKHVALRIPGLLRSWCVAPPPLLPPRSPSSPGSDQFISLSNSLCSWTVLLSHLPPLVDSLRLAQVRCGISPPLTGRLRRCVRCFRRYCSRLPNR